jgi:hypothetical protein
MKISSGGMRSERCGIDWESVSKPDMKKGRSRIEYMLEPIEIVGESGWDENLMRVFMGTDGIVDGSRCENPHSHVCKNSLISGCFPAFC